MDKSRGDERQPIPAHTRTYALAGDQVVIAVEKGGIVRMPIEQLAAFLTSIGYNEVTE